jgi:hypothetical protein
VEKNDFNAFEEYASRVKDIKQFLENFSWYFDRNTSIPKPQRLDNFDHYLRILKAAGHDLNQDLYPAADTKNTSLISEILSHDSIDPDYLKTALAEGCVLPETFGYFNETPVRHMVESFGSAYFDDDDEATIRERTDSLAVMKIILKSEKGKEKDYSRELQDFYENVDNDWAVMSAKQKPYCIEMLKLFKQYGASELVKQKDMKAHNVPDEVIKEVLK